MDPPQLSIDALYTTTQNLADIAQCTYIWTADGPPAIEHRYLAYHYTNLADIAQCTYIPKADGPPSQSSIDALHTITPDLEDIVQCTYIPTAHGLPPLSIEHRCLAYCYTKLGRYSTMHIYPNSRWTPLN